MTGIYRKWLLQEKRLGYYYGVRLKKWLVIQESMAMISIMTPFITPLTFPHRMIFLFNTGTLKTRHLNPRKALSIAV